MIVHAEQKPRHVVERHEPLRAYLEPVSRFVRAHQPIGAASPAQSVRNSPGVRHFHDALHVAVGRNGFSRLQGSAGETGELFEKRLSAAHFFQALELAGFGADIRYRHVQISRRLVAPYRAGDAPLAFAGALPVVSVPSLYEVRESFQKTSFACAVERQAKGFAQDLARIVAFEAHYFAHEAHPLYGAAIFAKHPHLAL